MADLDSFHGKRFGIKDTEAGLIVLAEKFTGIQQHSFSDVFYFMDVVVSVADDIENALGCESPGHLRIVGEGDLAAACLHCAKDSVVGHGGEPGAAKLGNYMLIADVVAVDQVDGAAEFGKDVQHERRNQISAVDQHCYAVSVAEFDRGSQIGNVVMGVGKDCYSHVYVCSG